MEETLLVPVTLLRLTEVVLKAFRDFEATICLACPIL